MRPKSRFIALLALPLLAVAALPAAEEENTSGLPTPEKADVPYLIHATNLVELEQSTANEETQKNDQLYWVAGANSPVQTPLAGPQFLFKSDETESCFSRP